MTDANPRLRALVAFDMPEPVRELLAAAFDADFVSPGGLSAAVAGAAGAGYEALLLSIGVKADAALIAALPDSIRAIGTYSVGLDHVDVQAAAARGLAVFNTPGVLADAVADSALLLLLGAARRATESIDLIRSRQWKGWTPTQLNGLELAGKRMGVLGMGGIGLPIAKRARAFGMEIAYCNRRPLDPEKAEGATYIPDPDDLVAASDVLMLACPLTDATRGFLNAERLRRARPNLIVINVGRGDLVVDDALIEALSTGRIFAAGLDVFSGEPNLDPRYYDLPNVFMLPHIGSSTIETRLRMGQALIDGLGAWREGRRPENQVC